MSEQLYIHSPTTFRVYVGIIDDKKRYEFMIQDTNRGENSILVSTFGGYY